MSARHKLAFRCIYYAVGIVASVAVAARVAELAASNRDRSRQQGDRDVAPPFRVVDSSLLAPDLYAAAPDHEAIDGSRHSTLLVLVSASSHASKALLDKWSRVLGARPLHLRPLVRIAATDDPQAFAELAGRMARDSPTRLVKVADLQSYAAMTGLLSVPVSVVLTADRGVTALLAGLPDEALLAEALDSARLDDKMRRRPLTWRNLSDLSRLVPPNNRAP